MKKTAGAVLLVCVLYVPLALAQVDVTDTPSGDTGTRAETGEQVAPGENQSNTNEGTANTGNAEGQGAAQEAGKTGSPERRAENAERRTAPVRRAERRGSEKQEPEQEGTAFESSGLLNVGEGNYLLVRIPEIEVETQKADADNDFVNIREERDETPGETDESILGMNKKKTETIAKISIIVLIFIIFLLYRSRSRSSGRKKVVRTFPKK